MLHACRIHAQVRVATAHLGSGGCGGGALALRGAHEQLRGLLRGGRAVVQLRLQLLQLRHLAPQLPDLQEDHR